MTASMDVIKIPGIRFQGRTLSMECKGTSKDDANSARDLRQLLLKDNRTSRDSKVDFFRWIKRPNSDEWDYIL